MDFFRELINDGEAFTVGAPVDGARDALARRLDNGAQVSLITARLVPEVEHLAVAATHHWLDHHRVPFTRLVVCTMNDNKARLVPDATGAVDDSVTQIRNWRDHGVSACLFDHPANRYADDPYRVIGWDQATTFLATS